MFEVICRTLISVLVSSGQRQFKCTTGECNAERKNSEEFRLPWCKVNSDLWAHRPCRMQTHHTDTEQRQLPCPAHRTGKAQQHVVNYMFENVPREVVHKYVLACISQLPIPSQFSKSPYFSVTQLIKIFACGGPNTLPERGYIKNTSTKAFPWQWHHSPGIAALLENSDWTSCPKEQVISVKLKV